MPPGSRLLAFATQWFDERTVVRVFEPLIADYQREWAAAPRCRQTAITMRAVAAFAASAIAVTPRALLFTPTPPAILRRILSRMMLFAAVTSGVMVAPFLFELRTVPPARLAWLLFLLLPSALVLMLPFAAGFTVDGIRRQASSSPLERVAALRVALCTALFLIALGGWMAPAANQQFRVTVAADRQWRPPARGARELTTPQLINHPWLARAEDPVGRARAIRRELHSRASFALLPMVLIWLRWRALSFPSPQWLLPAWLAAITSFGTYSFVRWNGTAIESAYHLPIGGAAWVPLGVLVIAGLTRDYFAKRVINACPAEPR